MLNIPKQLINQRFILITPSKNPKICKVPYEKGWNKEQNYSYEELGTMNVPKYGVLCGHNNLMVIDCDSSKFQEACEKLPLFQNTFTCKTATKGLYHYYFYCDGDSGARYDVDKIRVADLQGKGTQVLGPGSKLETVDNMYEVVRDNEIQNVPLESLKELCSTMIPGIGEIKNAEPKKVDRKGNINNDEIDPVINYIKSKLTIRDLLEEWNIDTHSGKNCGCPFHSSESNACLSYEDHFYHCFHCNRSGSIFDLASEYYKESFNEVKDRLADKVGVPKAVIKQAQQMVQAKLKADASELLVTKFLESNSIMTTRNDLKTEVWIYNNGIYIPNGKSYIGQFIRATLQEYFTTHIYNLVLEKIMRDTYVEEEDFFNTVYPDEVPVMNGILNIRTNKLSGFTSSRIFFNKLPVYYNPDIKSEKFMGFLKSTVKTEKDIETIQEAFGYCLWKDNKYKKAFFLIGGGDNGKSVLLDGFESLIGVSNISNVSLHDLDTEKFSAAGLFGKMVNMNADISGQKLNESQLFKKLVSGDSIEAHRKFMTPVKFKNYAKFFFAANNVPDTDDKSDGFFTRWSVIKFPYSFKKQIDYDLLSDEDKASGKYKIADIEMTDKITTSSELSGMLNWSLEGLHRLWKNKGQFTNSVSTQEVKDFWDKNSSSMKSFLIDCCEITVNNSDYIVAEDLHVSYTKYCKEKGIIPQIKKECGAILSSNPIKYSQKAIKNAESGLFENKRVWVGIKYL